MRYGCFYFFMKEESKEVRKRTKAIAITSYNFLMKFFFLFPNIRKADHPFRQLPRSQLEAPEPMIPEGKNNQLAVAAYPHSGMVFPLSML